MSLCPRRRARSYIQYLERHQCRAEPLERRRMLSMTTYYVDDSATGLSDGSSWTDAYTGLQPALTAAASGDTIQVGQGTYRPTTTLARGISFMLKDGVAVMGGYRGVGSPAPDARD